MREHNIPLVRRKSGGGAVFHDLGNSNYSVIMPRHAFQRKTSASIICRALHQLDIPASVNDRFDIVIGDCKISGSAYKLTNEKAYHHGTMLIDSDLSQLGQFLRPSNVLLFSTFYKKAFFYLDLTFQKNIQSQGVASVRSKVTRLREHSFTVDHTSFCDATVEEFAKHYDVSDIEVPAFLDFDKFEKLI
jgi:lipoate-protein ligase A